MLKKSHSIEWLFCRFTLVYVPINQQVAWSIAIEVYNGMESKGISNPEATMRVLLL